MTLYDDPNDVFLCDNCDSEFTVVKIDDEEADVCYCPYCGEPVIDIEDDDDAILGPDDDEYLN